MHTDKTVSLVTIPRGNGKSFAMFALTILLLSVFGTVFADVGSCNRTVAPPSWLTTTGRGLLGWATAGTPHNGPNFCLEGDISAGTVEVDYHMDVQPGSLQTLELPRVPWNRDDNTTKNGCQNKDPRIKYCVPFCAPDLENIITKAALQYRIPYQLTGEIFDNAGKPKNTAITAIQVSLTDPNAHLNCQIFLDPCWCSVYIGIAPDFGSPYLFEIQFAKILPK